MTTKTDNYREIEQQLRSDKGYGYGEKVAAADAIDALIKERDALREAGRKLVANVAGLEKMFDTKEEAAEFSELWRDFVKVLANDDKAFQEKIKGLP